MNGRQRVQMLLDGGLPDRPPHFDLLRNDAVLSHLAGETLTIENADPVVYRAMARAVDGTRPVVRLPQAEGQYHLPDGREERRYRWTTWVSNPPVPDLDEYARAKRAQIDALRVWDAASEQELDRYIREMQTLEEKMPGVYLFWPVHGAVGLHSMCYEIGIEQFSYVLADMPELVEEYLEATTAHTIRWLGALGARRIGVGAFFIADDIAFRTSTVLSPAQLRRLFFPRLKRIIAAAHELRARAMFHSDGNLMAVLDDLLSAGIDLLNPIEVLAGMDIAEIHRRAPELILAGGIDVSQLLPHGTPAEIAAAVHAAVRAAGGRIMVGSSTELHNSVPLANYLAMLETIRSISLR